MILGTRVTSNGNTDIWIGTESSFTDIRAVTASEINNAPVVRATPSIAWDGTTFPAFTESDALDDRSIEDAGNATTRGANSFEATLSAFYPKSNTDTTSDYGKLYNFQRNLSSVVLLITRVLQRTTNVATAAAAGEYISTFKVIPGSFEENLDGDDSYKYARSYLPQGFARAYTFVAGETGTLALEGGSTAPVAVGDIAVYRAEVGNNWANRNVEWFSSNPSVATVSQNGVVTAVDSGTADIGYTHPAITDPAPITLTIA